MKAIFAILVLLATSAIAAETPIALNLSPTGPDELRVTGPTTGEVGREITLIVRGLPEVNLDQTVNDVLGLFQHVRASASTPGEPIDLDSEIGFTVAPVAYRMKLLFTPQEPGVYVVAVDWNEPPFGLALHRIEIRGPPGPPEDPPEDPTKPPPNQQATGAVYIFEKDLHLVPRPVSAALNRLNLERESFVAAEMDQDVIAGGGQAPIQYQAALAAAKHAGLPALVVLGASGVLRVVKNPQTEADVMEAVR